MRRVLPLAILLIFCSRVTTLAQKAPRPKGRITVAEILDNYVTATGGPEAWRALQTVDAHGRFGIPNIRNSSGDFDFYYRAPANDVFQLFTISHGQTWAGHNGGTPFFNRTVGGAFGINGVTVYILEENWLALTDSAFDQHYGSIELVGLAAIGGKWAYALRFTPKVGDPQLRYYDCQSFLMVRMDLAQRIRMQKDGPEFAYKVETYYSDFRDSGGVKFPRQIKATSSNGNIVLNIYDVRTNHPVDDAVFLRK
jgi:hypothetical protein